MLPWIFVVLLALNLALFLWGYRNEHLREAPLPPVPAGQFEIRLLSEVEGERPAPGDDERPPQETGTAPDLPSAGDPPTAAAPVSGAEEHAPADDLIEPGSTGEETWVERELIGDTEAEAPPEDRPASSLDAEPYAEPTPAVEGTEGPAGEPEQAPAVDLEPAGDATPEPPPPPTLDERPEPPPRDIPPFPELPIQQPRTPGGVSASIESTA